MKMMKTGTRLITRQRTQHYLGSDVLVILNRLVTSVEYRKSKLFILADRNTSFHCLPYLLEQAPALSDATILTVDGGEDCKSLQTAADMWQQLHEKSADRQSLLINLGGGVVSDLGGFVASGYYRGIKYINVPTSLVGQADAAIGGKTGVNLDKVKNQVGSFYPPESVFICPGLLRTLPAGHFRSGLAEIIKSMLLDNPAYWRKIKKIPVAGLMEQPYDSRLVSDMTALSVKYKTRLVTRDFRETNIRKALNFGHTIGHAFESF